jgi:uncharacterized protein
MSRIKAALERWHEQKGNVAPPEVRIVGIDDGPFERGRRRDVQVVGAIYRGGQFLDGMVATKIRQDGRNSTDKLVEMVMKSRYFPQLHYLMLDGIALGGFNVVDIERLWEETKLPVLVVVRKRPDMVAVKKALFSLPRGAERWRLIEKAGEVESIGGVFVQRAGLEPGETAALLAASCTRSKLPEPIRAAHIIAGALVTGEGGRRA